MSFRQIGYFRFFTFFLVLLAAGCTQPPPLPPLASNAVILAFGDSLTAGTGAIGGGYPQRLQKIIGRKVINAGIRGETSAGARQRLPGLLQRHRPQLLIVCTGGNDFLRRHNRTETENNVREIIAIARRTSVPVVLIAVPKVLPVPINHPMYKTIADDYGLWLEDDILKTVLHDNALKSDRVHPNDAGYQQIAEAVAALLARAGAV